MIMRIQDAGSNLLFKMRVLVIVWVGFAGLVLGSSSAEGALKLSPVTDEAQAIAPLPDAVGRAGMAATVTDESGKPVVLAVGGANFPSGLLWEGGKKVYYTDIYKLKEGNWENVGSYPKPVGYAAFAPLTKGMVVAGGMNESGVLADVNLIQPDGKVIALPPLPHPVANAAFAMRNGRLYVFGGQESLESVHALKSAYMLDLSGFADAEAKLKWQTLPEIPGEGRILSTAAASGTKVYLFGGASLKPNEQGGAERTNLTEVLCFDTADGKWLDKGKEPVANMPAPVVACANPAPAREGKILLIGGDDGSHYGKTPESHAGQLNTVYLYDTLTNTWEKGTDWPIGVATVPAVLLGGKLLTISGEVKPGIRTPLVAYANISYALDMHLVDYCVFGLIALVVVILLLQIKKNGMKNVAVIADASSRPGMYAWVVVGLLWVVAMLNYFDRQLLTTIREPVVRDIPQTEMQFGLLTGVFLLIYSLLSPMGGFLADRYSRRVVILGSLVVWSTVTWITGHVHDYTTLFIARALMGVSEACYIPAALALITDYHRGRTRSLATGIHMSGVYAGMALAGLGGTMAEATGWRLTFGLFGLIGVAYALVLVLFLRDPGNELGKRRKGSEKSAFALAEEGAEGSSREERLAVESSSTDAPKLGFVLKSILSKRAIWVLMGVVACSGAANWFLLAWFPTLLLEKFNLSLSDAGRNATLWSTMAKYLAVIVGAIIADQWAVKNPRGRSLLPGIIFCISGPVIALSPFIPAEMTGAFVLLLIFVATQGLAQGTMDATLMPVMRSHIGGRFAATGYGFLNFISAGFGAITVIYGGKLKDMGVELGTTLAYTGGLLLIGGILFLLVPKPDSNLEGGD